MVRYMWHKINLLGIHTLYFNSFTGVATLKMIYTTASLPQVIVFQLTRIFRGCIVTLFFITTIYLCLAQKIPD